MTQIALTVKYHRKIRWQRTTQILLRFGLIIAIFASTGLVIFAQKQPLCDQFEGVVRDNFTGVEIGRNDRFTDDCTFEFRVGGTEKIYISIERYEDLRSTRRAFKRDAELLESGDFSVPPRYKRVKIRWTNEWDKIIAYQSDLRENYFMLRRRNYVITVIASQFEILRTVESKIGDLDWIQSKK